jgi:hypothetical protein
MNTDKALQKVLRRKSDELPFGFDDKVMRQILLEAERKGRLTYYRSLGLVSFVSMALIVGTLYVLYTYFNFNFLDLFAGIHLSVMENPSSPVANELRPVVAFSVYIALLMLFLLGMDYFFRKRIGKTKKG